MKSKKLNQKGFFHIESFFFIILLVVISGVGYYVFDHNKSAHAGSLCKGQTFQVGSTGTCVKYLQTLSVSFTGIKMPIDGIYGSLTKSNILVFQKKAFPNAKTQWDGIAGPNTWGKLCSLIPITKTQAVYNSQKDACGTASFSVSAQATPTNYGFNTPYAITSDNLGHVWVTNQKSNSVTEINAKDGSLVQVLKAAKYGFNALTAITTDSLGHVWVANGSGDSVTELNAKDGSLVRVISSSNYGIKYPWKIISDNHGNIWILDRSSKDFKGHITEINAKDGSLVRYLTFSQWSDTTDLGYDNLGHIWVVTAGAGLAEIDSNSGSLIKIIPGYVESIASDNLGHVWVTNNNSVTELNAKDGSLVQVLKDAKYGFNTPRLVTSDNLGHIWVTNYHGNSVTELNAKDGSLVRVVK